MLFPSTLLLSLLSVASAVTIRPRDHQDKCLYWDFGQNKAAIRTCSGAAVEQWDRSNDHLRLQGRTDCLVPVTGYNGAGLQFWSCSFYYPQLYDRRKWTQVGDSLKFLNLGDICLDNEMGRTTDGNRAQVWGCAGNPNQAWVFR